MASIALCVGDTGHSSTTNASADLSSFGHTVSIYNESTVTLAQLMAVDIICWLRSSAATVTSGLSAIKSALNAGKPVIFSAKAGYSSGSAEPAVQQGVHLRFCGNQTIRSLANVYFYDGTSKLLFGSPTTSGFFPAISASGMAPQCKTNQVFLVSDSEPGVVMSAYAYKGTPDLDGNPFGANIGFCSSLYRFDASMTTQAKTVLQNLITDLLRPMVNVPASVAGLSDLSTDIFILDSNKKNIISIAVNSAGESNNLYLPVGAYTAICESTDPVKNSLIIDFNVE